MAVDSRPNTSVLRNDERIENSASGVGRCTRSGTVENK